MKKPTLAAVLIVKNEADNLRKCLASLDGLVDEIVILDSGSQDETPAIAAEFGARFFVNAKWPGFGKQRRLAQSHVQSDWVLWLDADERLTPELKTAIANVMANPASDTIYSIPRLSWVFGRFIRHSGWYPDRVLRLYPKALTSYNEALVHEKVEVRANMKIVNLSWRPAPLHLSGSGALSGQIRRLCPRLGRSAHRSRQEGLPQSGADPRGRLLPQDVPAQSGLPRWQAGVAAGDPLRPLHLRQIRRPLGAPATAAAGIAPYPTPPQVRQFAPLFQRNKGANCMAADRAEPLQGAQWQTGG